MTYQLLLGFPEYADQTEALAGALGIEARIVELHQFPDGESRIRLPVPIPAEVMFCRSLDHPNEKLIELLLAVETARRMGTQRCSLVAPYLCYMRQDAEFRPGEAISQLAVGRLLGMHFDHLATVDPHLHRVSNLEQVVRGARALTVAAAPLISTYLAQRAAGALLLGPDAESEQWVRGVAERAGLDYAVARKTRLGDREVRIELPETNLANQSVVIIDDVASSGETVAVAARAALQAGATRVDLMVTHGLFARGGVERIRQAGVREVWSTDSIPHSSNVVRLAPLLAEALGEFENPSQVRIATGATR